MEDGIARRSRRSHYDSNGRDYLSDELGFTRETLDTWILSSSVKKHLRLWHQVCVGSPRRFNDAVSWINDGPEGYYYDTDQLEEDLLVLCLAEEDNTGKVQIEKRTIEGVKYGVFTTKTSSWTTQELWARAAWRIVNDNRSGGQPFAKLVETQRAACYSVAIDLLCIAFHSIAFRGQASVYESLINGDSHSASAANNIRGFKNNESPTKSYDGTSLVSDNGSSSSSITGVSSDAEFINDETNTTSEVPSPHGEKDV